MMFMHNASMDKISKRPFGAFLFRGRNFSGLYRGLMRLHSALPYWFFSSGFALPAWHYFLEVTRRCNLRCSMCAFRRYAERNSPAELMEKELQTDEWKKVIDQTGRWSLITFTGGEPWVRQDFDELLTYASQKRRTHVITNGLLLNEERIRLCVDLAPRSMVGHGLVSLGISLDGTREIHDRIRGREGAFDQTMEVIRGLIARRRVLSTPFPFVHVTAVIQDENVEALPDLARQLGAEGVDVFNLTLEVRFADLDGLGETDPEAFCGVDVGVPRIEASRLTTAMRRTQEAAAASRMELRLPDMPISEMVAYYNGGMDLAHFTCRSPWTNVYIGADGYVYPCFIYKLGNVRERSLHELWNGANMREFRRRVRQELFCICQGCCHLEPRG
ncbi:MAG TPA: radical SAM protein [Candidatus Hydrogenedentes bacterium]|nr:radical SAM protein [Candidatus Hydrogenedentota bacterium]